MNSNTELETVLVTGGSGFIGSHLCENLLDKGYHVVCLDNFNDFYDPAKKVRNVKDLLEDPKFTLIPGDILNDNLLKAIFTGNEKSIRSLSLDVNLKGLSEGSNDLTSISKYLSEGGGPDKIIHLAAMAGVRPSLVDPAKYVDVDIKGTVNLLEMARQYEVEKFVFGSSSSVYGVNEEVPFSEDDITDKQVSPYATAKKAAEQYCKTYNHLYDIPVAALRFFTVYGPRQRPEMAIHKFARLMVNNEPIPMYGDGTSERDYTYVNDIVNGIMGALDNDYDFEIFNLGNSETVQLRSLIDLIAKGLNIDPEIDQQPEQPGDVPITYADISKARAELGYDPEVSIEEGIEKFLRWFKSVER